MKLSHHTGTDDSDLHSPEKELIHSKIKYLKNYLEISRDRSCGADYLCIYNLIKNQEIAWLNFFEESLNDNKEKSTVEDVISNFKKLRENYSFDLQINDIFSFALEYASIDNLLENQHSKLLNGIILTEDQRNKFLELNRIFLSNSKDPILNPYPT